MCMNTIIENGYKGLSKDTGRSNDGRIETFYTLETHTEEEDDKESDKDSSSTLSTDDESIMELIESKLCYLTIYCVIMIHTLSNIMFYCFQLLQQLSVLMLMS